MADDDDIGADMMDDMGDVADGFAVLEDDAAVAAADDATRDNPLASLLRHHPECIVDYAETIAPKIPLIASPPLNKDPNHRSVPFLTQYERTHVLGKRANMLSQGARPYIAVPEYITDVGEIAKLELAQRRLPFIIRRTMPNGEHEYWRLSDLLIL
jgi:DNA-directed RNA polymerase I, II, and III subunit RPABC2